MFLGEGVKSRTKSSKPCALSPASVPFILRPLPQVHFFKGLIYFLGRGEGREKGRERNISVWLLLNRPHWGPGSQPRHVTWLGIEPVTLWFAARAQSTELHQPGLILFTALFLSLTFISLPFQNLSLKCNIGALRWLLEGFFQWPWTS